ncbi:acyl-CoA N-acyltransferase [Aspergillus heteromorphus CBS 117.55]|uniref:Acyl-CoA N-acyltransferase n=1 Tax=Aspergillus heteromorphus CBS 117.55 TaxID=1448321 RepID=A0A317WPI0_9EURO|nr:acyl-CoA N-acyltransferase [Aspergillus heteromorphus CBS 117.55]PWY88339.1 acyl-CoA N-acyltransferase [Aspergillus heteromorphus CBS 117.55]
MQKPTTPPAPTFAPPNHRSRLTVSPALPSDSTALTDTFLAAFSDDFNRRLFPPTPDVRSWWVEQFRRDIELAGGRDPSCAVLKVVDEDGVIAGFAKWQFPVPVSASNDGHGAGVGDEEKVAWPPSSDSELCERFFGDIHAEKGRVMDLDMLGTRPDFNGRGVGSSLLRWGLQRADEVGVDTFLASTPQGRPLYEKYGFRVVREWEVIPGYRQAAMVREK